MQLTVAASVSEVVGGTIALKAENLQRAGSVKVRGAAAKITTIGHGGGAAGVVTGSAGNHAQAVACVARAHRLPCEVFVPAGVLLLVERAKLVVEGAGAVGLAALMTGAVRPATRGTTIAVLSGGNIDPGLLATLIQWTETGSGRRLRLFTRVRDRPGGLAGLLQAVAEGGANVLEVDHVRDGVARQVRETGIELTLETRGEEHADAICAMLRKRGYEVRPG